MALQFLLHSLGVFDRYVRVLFAVQQHRRRVLGRNVTKRLVLLVPVVIIRIVPTHFVQPNFPLVSEQVKQSATQIALHGVVGATLGDRGATNGNAGFVFFHRRVFRPVVLARRCKRIPGQLGIRG